MTNGEPARLAASLGDGHWLLSGMAGSGKTLALASRVRYLRDRHPAWRTLLVCFNRSLANSLRQSVGAGPHLTVATFHDWAQGQLEAGGVAVPPPPGRGTLWDRYWTQDVARLLLGAFQAGRIPSAVYQAILVDEGQDFVDDWYRALLGALDPATDSLCIAVDPSQNIYNRTIGWRALGVGERTRLLGGNHRNTGPIFRAARHMIRDVDGAGGAPPAADVDAAPALRDGPMPEVRRCASFGASREHALSWVRDRLARGVPPADILVLGMSRLDMTTVNAWLNSKNIAAWLPAETERSEGIRVSTIHSAKGLDADSVLLLDAHQLQSREDTEARRLLYMAMTRARLNLCISYFRDTPLVAELEQACAAA